METNSRGLVALGLPCRTATVLQRRFAAAQLSRRFRESAQLESPWAGGQELCKVSYLSCDPSIFLSFAPRFIAGLANKPRTLNRFNGLSGGAAKTVETALEENPSRSPRDESRGEG